MYTYLIINIAVIIVPFLFSFNRRINYYKNWKYLFPAILISSTLFIAWDVYFTRIGVWHFNPLYLSGITLLNLPVEEWLFFITIPYSCLFIYVSINNLLKVNWTFNALLITGILAVVLAGIGIFNWDKIYTCTTCTLAAAFLIFHYIRKSHFLHAFYVMYAISLIPFLVVNGILTALPVVIYQNAENLGIRIHTIPVEDFAYSLLLLLMNVSIFEWFKKNSIRGTLTA